MLTKFAEGLSEELDKNWMTAVLTPAFVFWAGGLAAWGQKHGWGQFFEWFNGKTPLLQGELLVGGLLVVAASGAIVEQFDLTVLHVLEGYWPAWLRPLRRGLVRWRDKAIIKAEERFQELALKQEDSTLSYTEKEELSGLDWRLMNVPPANLRMPTRFGNILRAAELRPLYKYGLDAVICWPRLWLALSEDVRAELLGARATLNNSARLCLWGALFLIWSVWSWWAVPVSFLTISLAYRWMLSSAEIYGILIESTFDIFRTALYKSLRWPLPSHPGEERRIGAALTAYLWRGSDQPITKFLPLPEDANSKAKK
jgi:hypothetical protein